ncbi:unnamed protein product [Ceutorhynchus assimilis]|uniref:Uncharacterized protein n=1 Tax=Ceutorhynchus assimilis TaxID=467358 RepID=A0A9N9QMF9_9CUCU|nr:unnamed protein product [Ceutorhynchus assimilis]
MTVSNQTLVKIGAIGGVATIIMGFLARDNMQSKIKGAPFYNEAMKLVRKHPGAVSLLGEPIKEGRIDVGNKENFVNVEENLAKFKVPLKGPKQKGTMFLTGTKQDNDEQWSIGCIELEVASHPNKRLLIINNNTSS